MGFFTSGEKGLNDQVDLSTRVMNQSPNKVAVEIYDSEATVHNLVLHHFRGPPELKP